MLMQNDELQTSNLDDGQFLCLARNVICLNYIVQIQYYPLIFSKLHDVLLKRDVFFKRIPDHPMILTILGLAVLLASLGLFGCGS